METMKNHIFILFALIAALIITGKTAKVVTAQSEPPESTVSIEFEEGEAIVPPLDPEDPDTIGNGGTGNSGALALNYVSNFYFNKEEILTHAAEYPTTTQTPYIQITDARGTGKGWSVSARASKFKTALGKDSLFGASITLKDASSISPTPELPKPQPKDPVTIKFNGSDLVEVVSAQEDTGMGTWLIRWYTDPVALTNSSVVLSVPSGAGMKGQNTATITWILSNAPA